MTIEKLVTKKITVKIDDIVANPWNPNKMPDVLFEKMKKVIEEKGLFGSIFVRPLAGAYEILDGEHRWRALKELGYKEVPVEASINEMTEQEVKFWTIYFNNTRGKDDVEKRAQIFEELDKGQTTFLPWTEEEIENEKELFKFDFSKYDKVEEIQERVINRTFMVPMTDEEWEVLQRCLELAKKDYKQDEISWLMEVCGDYLDPRIGTEWRKKEIKEDTNF